jgi:activator of HSP90 ATPase
MLTQFISRRSLVRIAAVPIALAAAPRCFAAPAAAATSSPAANGLSHSSEAIHQEITFNAARRLVYAALTDPKQFDAVTRLSDAVTLVTAAGAKPTAINQEVGGAFVLFGGYITGRHLELVPDERLVQAWRAGSWAAGEYSIARFALHDAGAGCKLVFDHRGFPKGEGVHLAPGWHSHYWEPLAKFLR